MADMATVKRSSHCSDDGIALLSVGSNAAGSHMRVAQAMAVAGGRFGVLGASAVFVTPDIRADVIPMMPRTPYANAVMAVAIPRPPLLSASYPSFNAGLKEIEYLLGRRKEHKQHGLVNIDIDAVTFDGYILRPADWMRPYYHPRALTV